MTFITYVTFALHTKVMKVMKVMEVGAQDRCLQTFITSMNSITYITSPYANGPTSPS